METENVQLVTGQELSFMVLANAKNAADRVIVRSVKAQGNSLNKNQD